MNFYSALPRLLHGFLDLLDNHPPISVEWRDPVPSATPDAHRVKALRTKKLWEARVSIANFSSSTLRNIRIKLPFPPQAPVPVSCADSLLRGWTYVPQSFEIQIDTLDPKTEAAFVVSHVGEPVYVRPYDFLCNGRQVSRRSRTLGMLFSQQGNKATHQSTGARRISSQ